MIVNRGHPVNRIKLVSDKVFFPHNDSVVQKLCTFCVKNLKDRVIGNISMQSIRNLIYAMSCLCDCYDLENSVEQSQTPLHCCMVERKRHFGDPLPYLTTTPTVAWINTSPLFCAEYFHKIREVLGKIEEGRHCFKT